VLKVEIPVQQRRSAYLQVSEKSMFDWALVSCAASARLEGGKVTQARVVLGAVSNVPYMAQEANDALEGVTLDEAAANKAAGLLLDKAQAHSQNGFKIPMAKALIRRTLLQLKA
jgi:xanthine dehydrogenase YagS FAD-binding subunit